MNYDREKLTITQIENQQSNIKQETLLLGASAFAVGIGALGVYLLGDDVINSLKANITSSYIVVHLKTIGFMVSGITLYKGITSVIEHIRNIQFAKDKLDFYNEVLDKEGKTIW